MANIKSAIKRVQISERNRLRNKAYKSAVRTLTKKYFQAVDAYVSEPGADAENTIKFTRSAAVSKIDKAVKRGVYHRNNGDRKKSRLDRYYKAATASLSS
ncbi:MAG: 30S ribosomal protein S20 [Cyanobacteria bacterium P01_C01_bin.89]